EQLTLLATQPAQWSGDALPLGDELEGGILDAQVAAVIRIVGRVGVEAAARGGRLRHLVRVQPEAAGDLGDVGAGHLTDVLGGQPSLDLLESAWWAHHPRPVPEVPLELAADRGGGERREVTAVGPVAASGLDEGEPGDLLEILGVDAATGVSVRERVGETEMLQHEVTRTVGGLIGVRHESSARGRESNAAVVLNLDQRHTARGARQPERGGPTSAEVGPVSRTARTAERCRGRAVQDLPVRRES